MPRIFRLIPTLLLFAAGHSPASAQTTPPDLQAVVKSDKIAIGEIGILVIKAINGDPESLPDKIEVEGLTITSAGSQPGENFRISIINGVRTTESSYLYRFQGNSEGTYTIPAIETRIGGVAVSSAPIQVTVYERSGEDNSLDATKPVFGKFSLSKTELWAKEIVPFSVTGYVRGRGAIHDVVSAELSHESFVIQKFKNVRNDAVELSGNLYSLARLPSALFSLKDGTHTLGPATIGIRVLDRSSGFGFPGIFQRTQTHSVSTNSLTITVKPLPPGAPSSFRGSVGDFEIAAQASTNSVSIGDPISMEFVVTGIGNFTTVGAPVFPNTATTSGEWRTYDASQTVETESDGETTGRSRVSQVVIPLRQVSEIPGFEFSYFSPTTGSYVTKTTPPIPISVSTGAGGRSLPGGSDSSIPAGSSGLPSVSVADRPEAQFNDVLHIRTGTPRWQPAIANPSPGPLYYVTQFAFSLGFFTILTLGLARIVQKRKKERQTAHISLSFKQAVRAIPRSGATRREYYHGVDRALEIWRKEHGDAPDKVLEAIDHLTEKCQSHLYSGSELPDEPVTRSEMEEFNSILVKLSHK